MPRLSGRRPHTPAVETRVNHRSSAHRAGLQGDVQSAAEEPVIAKSARSLPQSDDLGVGRRIAGAYHGVLSSRDDLASTNHNRADGHFTGHVGFARFSEGVLHGFEIGNHGLNGTAKPVIVNHFSPSLISPRLYVQTRMQQKERSVQVFVIMCRSLSY